MKIEVSLHNAVRFETDENTALHVHTEHVDPNEPLWVRPKTGPSLFLKRNSLNDKYPRADAPTPYGFGRSEITGFQFHVEDFENYATTVDSENPTLLQWFIGTILPYILIFGVFIFILLQMQGGGSRVMQFGKAKAKQVSRDMPKVTFKDLARLMVEADLEAEGRHPTRSR